MSGSKSSTMRLSLEMPYGSLVTHTHIRYLLMHPSTELSPPGNILMTLYIFPLCLVLLPSSAHLWLMPLCHWHLLPWSSCVIKNDWLVRIQNINDSVCIFKKIQKTKTKNKTKQNKTKQKTKTKFNKTVFVGGAMRSC